mmetsp:Transcript_25869/g.56757  ORF Transcript_25869/g.56757 Transcript_25869/m.56757 type:complete len:256 (+) Transcript_25869:385-1152(+)
MADTALAASIRAARARRLEDEIGGGDDGGGGGGDAKEAFARSELDPSKSMSITRLVSVKKDISTYASAARADDEEQMESGTAGGETASNPKKGGGEATRCGGAFTNSEIFTFVISIPGPLVLLGFAFAYWYDCTPIPSLAYNVALAAVFELALAICAFAWHVERLRENGDGRQNDGYLSSPALVAYDFLATMVLVIAIWGAVLTFGRWDVMGMEEGQCNSALYLGAFISSVITFLFVLYEMGESCYDTFVEKDED